MKKLTIILTVALLWCGCEETAGTHIGNPSTSTVGIALEATSSDGGSGFSDDGGLAMTLADARLYVTAIELELPAGAHCSAYESGLTGPVSCANEGSGQGQQNRETIMVQGPFAADLMAGTATPDLSSVGIPPLRYQHVVVRVALGDTAGGVLASDDELVGLSFAARASFEYMSSPAELRMRLGFQGDLEFSLGGNVELEPGDNLIVEFDAAGWLKGIRLGDCLDNGDLTMEEGVVVIDEDAGTGECAQTRNQFEENVRGSGQVRAGRN